MREIQFKGIMKVDKLFAEYSWLMLLKRIKLINIAQDLLKVIVMERLAQTPMKMRSFLVFFKCVLQLIHASRHKPLPVFCLLLQACESLY